MTRFIIVLLALIAGAVSVMQYRTGRRDRSLMWALIVLYWVTLTVKNALDLV